MSNPITASTTISSLSVTSQPAPRSRSFYCVHRLTITLIFVFVLIMAIFRIAWLILNPTPPVFTLNSLSISNLTLSNASVNAHYDAQFSVKNRNKKVRLAIDRFYVLVSYEATIISKPQMQTELKLQKMSEQSLSCDGVLDQLVPKKVFDHMSYDYRSKRVLNLKIKMTTRTKFMSEIWGTKETQMKVSCKNLTVKFFSSTGKLEGGEKECRVDLVG